MHANGFDYNDGKDVIYLRINFVNEIWVIDHSTTSAEAVTNSGVNYGRGGNILYRYGNPLAYDNIVGEVRGDRNQFPNLLQNGVPDKGNMLLYDNANTLGVSIIYELEKPQHFALILDADNELNVVWWCTNPSIFSGKISGAVRLKNGNILICEGDFGFWEITHVKDIACRYNGGDGGNFWRCYDYEVDHPALSDLVL